MSSSSASNEVDNLRITFKDVVSATNNFDDENLIKAGGTANVYKGNLFQFGEWIDVAVRIVLTQHRLSRYEFLEEIKELSSLKGRNIMSIVGFCDENDENIIVLEYAAKGSLEQYVSDPTTLTWSQRLEICLGVTRGFNSMNNQVHNKSGTYTYRDIKCSNILLNEDFEAKISCFGLTKNKYGHDNMVGYPLGLIFLQLLYGSELAVIGCESDLLAAMAEHNFVKEKLDESIDPSLRKQIHPLSFTIFLKTAYDCLTDRSMYDHLYETADRVENALEVQLRHENIMSQPNRLAWLKIPLSNINSATNNFDRTHIIGSGAYGEVYKAELDVFDSNHSFEEIESIDKYELPRKKKMVAIKRIMIREDEHGKDGFLMELSVLSRCDHPNIVMLLGYCDEDSEMILVYEHVANGSLDDYLRGKDNKNHFTWSRRLRVCLDIAYGIDYLHSTTKNKQTIIHRDIKSDNILLGNNWEVKIADFGLSKVFSTSLSKSTIITNNIAGTNLYIDPVYERHRMLKKESDIYSFGVVLFEILSGMLAYDYSYKSKDTKGIAPIARKHFKQGTLKDMVDPEIMKEAHEVCSIMKIGPNEDSLNTFLNIAHKCLAKTQNERPPIKDIVKELQKALSYQEHHTKILKVSLEDIKLGTENFSDENCIITGDYWKVYTAEILNDNRHMRVFIKRLSKSSQKEAFLTELEILYKHKHKNVIDVIGYCVENDEKIIVHEHLSNGSLSMHINKVSTLGWIERLKICIDVANGLDFLHEGVGTEKMVVHRDIKSSSILLNGDYKAKISDFGLSLITQISKDQEYAIDHFIGTPGYCEYPLNMDTRFISKESDIYSFGVVLFEILSGSLTAETYNTEHRYLDASVKQHFTEEKLDELVFQGIKEEIAPLSLATFQKIAYQCLEPSRQRRPRAGEVGKQLRKALEIQKMESESPSIHSNKQHKKEINRTEMVSAMDFSYINHSSHRWRSLPDSRFLKVAEMLDTSNLMIEIEAGKTEKELGYHRVHLVFRFLHSRKFSSQPMYVNLKYKMGSETLHAYFATWRDDGWMTIELSPIIIHNSHTVVKFLLESFSSCYCGDDAIYIEGIDFRVVDNHKYEEIKTYQKPKQVLRSNFNVNQLQQSSSSTVFSRVKNYVKSEKNMIWTSKVNGKKHLMLSAQEVLLNFPNVDPFISKPSTQSRFEDGIELLPQQLFCINCTIKSQMLSRDTSYVCYLVFKVSEKCDGLHYPVKVRDLLNQEKKEDEIIYFIPPSPWNVHVTTKVPEQREDRWMEVNVWKFNSTHKLENGCVPVNLKLMSYEGSMPSLIIYGLEFRPI